MSDQKVEWSRLVRSFAEARAAAAWPRAAAIAIEAIQNFPDRAHAHNVLAQSLIGLGRRPEAQASLIRSLAIIGEDPSLLDLAWRNAKSMGQTETAIALVERRLAVQPEDPSRLVDRARLELALLQGEWAVLTLSQAAAAGADPLTVLRLRAAAAEQAGLIEEARQAWREIEALGAVSAEELAAAALRLGHASAVSERISRNLGTLEDLLALESRDEGRALMSLAAGDASAWRRSGSGSLLLVFGGVLAMMGSVRASLPIDLPEGRGVNILSLVDPTRRFLLHGAPSFGPTYDETLSGLRRLLDAWAIDRLYVLGYSSGAHSALRYGLDLGARRMTMMSGWMTWPSDSSHPLLASLSERIGDAYQDPRLMVERAGGPVEIELAYGEANADDAWQAMQLADLPGVTLHPLPGVATHSLGLEPAHGELIRQLLRDAN